MATPKIAICTFVVGEKYKQAFESCFKKALERYCSKYGYELHVFTEPLEKIEPFITKKFLLQKILFPTLPQFKDYDYVLAIDTDIYINENAPPLPILQPGKIGCVNERKYLENYEWREMIQRQHGWEATGKDWYALSGESKLYDDHMNSGFVLYQPKYHSDLMKKLYLENVNNYAQWHQDDQSILSSFGIDNNLVEWIDQRYNRVWFFWRELFYPQFEKYPPYLKRVFVSRFVQLNWMTHWTSMMDTNILQLIINSKE